MTKAIRLAHRGKFDPAITVLEPEEGRYNRSYTYYYLLGLCYLRAGIFNRAYSYFKLARDVRMQDPPVLLALAALYLRRGDTGGAVDFYLEVQDHDPGNRIARRGLKVIRSHADSIAAWLESGRLEKLYPPLPRLPLRPRQFLLPLGAALAALVLGAGVLARLGLVSLPFGPPPKREAPPGLVLEGVEREEPVQIGGAYRYVLTRSQVLELYEEARLLFLDHRDDAARLALNRLLDSNAAEPVKNKARLLSSYLEAPGFDSLRDRFSYLQVREEPALYRDCHVIWRGMATNLVQGENSMAFDFLVGYDTRRVLEGTVAARFDFSIPLNLERPLEILARVAPLAGEPEGFRLEGVALNQAGLNYPPPPSP